MSLTKELGQLLITIENATVTVFGDNAFITHLIPSPKYKEDGTLLNITVTVLKDKYKEEEYKARLKIFDELVYNPLFHSERILSKIDLEVVERG